ncbi:MAG: ABC transporter ATP-binding protein [Planctomycetaceae bacterium]|jgi:ABC-type lipoprotein export system ATPase subunit|nr:ABC transporter ATP-binding protein [Planctomycetaceae bacterium]
MLSIANLKKTFTQPGGTTLPILDIPKFEVAAGEQVVLIGRSGGGKTTLLHNIAGITKIDSGSILFDGLPLQTLSQEMRDRFRATNMGYVFQTFNLLPAFTALENIMLGMAFAKGKTDREFAQTLLDRVGLKDRSGHRPAMMSVGEQQRVAVARALANRPRLLLADEPTANIDPANQQSIVDLIKESCEEFNIALILVTHTMEVASQFSRIDRLEDINQLAPRVEEVIS